MTFAAIGVLNIPLVVLSGLIASLIRHAPLVGNDVLTGSETGDGGTRLVMSLLISGLTSAAAFVVAAAAVAWIVDQSARGRRVTAIDAVESRLEPRSRPRTRVREGRCDRLGAEHLGDRHPVRDPSVGALPVHAARRDARGARWSDDRLHGARISCASGGGTRRCSIGIVYAILGGVGLVFGLALLVVFTGMPLWTLSLIVTMCNVFVMPLAAIAVTMLYGDAVAEQADRADVVRVAELAGSDA